MHFSVTGVGYNQLERLSLSLGSGLTSLTFMSLGRPVGKVPSWKDFFLCFIIFLIVLILFLGSKLS